MTDESPNITLRVRNYRCLRAVEWEIPVGVSAVVGPNGSGKSTLLSLPVFLGAFASQNLGAAIQTTGGMYGLRHLDARNDEFVELGLTLGDVEWAVKLPLDGSSVAPWVGENLRAGDREILVHPPFSAKGQILGQEVQFKQHESTFLNADVQAQLRHAGLSLTPFLARLNLARIQYRRALSYEIRYLRSAGSPGDSSTVLDEQGRNVWSVLRNWRDKRETRNRWDFVLRSMRRAFGNLFDDLDFEFTAQQVSARIYVPGRKESIPYHLFSDGWFTGLLHLCAVASAEKGSLLSIDEPENSLHPHAIRSLMESFAEWADENQLSIILATHSPVVLNQIKDRSRVFIMEPGHPTLPVSLDAHPNREWLEHFSIGDAYANEEVGAPAPREP
jgi:predicted ATPase